MSATDWTWSTAKREFKGDHCRVVAHITGSSWHMNVFRDGFNYGSVLKIERGSFGSRTDHKGGLFPNEVARLEPLAVLLVTTFDTLWAPAVGALSVAEQPKRGILSMVGLKK